MMTRIHREEGLRVRRRSDRKRALGTRAPTMIPQGPNRCRSLDFVSDAFVRRRRFRVLRVIDGFSRECVALVADTSLSGARVARKLDAVIAQRGRPVMVVSDNETELTSARSCNGRRIGALAGITPHQTSRHRPHSPIFRQAQD